MHDSKVLRGGCNAHHMNCAIRPLTLVYPAAISSPAMLTDGNTALTRLNGLLPF